MANSSKDIFNRQNLPGMIAAQKAAYFCYRKGKWLALLLACILILPPVAANIIIAFSGDESIKALLLFLSLLSCPISWMIGHFLNKAKFSGASLQQHFDIFVFGINGESKETFVPERLAEDERRMLILKYKDKDDTPFQNWYSDYSALPYEQAVYSCQKENVRWDISIRKRYFALMATLFSLIIIGIIINAIFQRTNILTFIATLSSAAPVFSYFCNALHKLRKDISIQKQLSDTIIEIDEKQTNESIRDEIEYLQVQIFNYRKILYLIPDWFYKMFRREMQIAEDDLAKNISHEL